VSLDTAAIAPLAGDSIAAALNGATLFSNLAALLSGEEIIFHPDGPSCVYSLTDADRGPLRAQRGVQGILRRGTLRTASGRRAAISRAVYLPNRIPDADALRALHMTSAPLSKVLGPLGVTRQSLGALPIATGDVAVRSRGLLLLGGVPVALAEEQVLRSFATAP
jgi:hypothetical protein